VPQSARRSRGGNFDSVPITYRFKTTLAASDRFRFDPIPRPWSYLSCIPRRMLSTVTCDRLRTAARTFCRSGRDGSEIRRR
jgi:hypothetical protein